MLEQGKGERLKVFREGSCTISGVQRINSIARTWIAHSWQEHNCTRLGGVLSLLKGGLSQQ